jgi:hypothetical protein
MNGAANGYQKDCFFSAWFGERQFLCNGLFLLGPPRQSHMIGLFEIEASSRLFDIGGSHWRFGEPPQRLLLDYNSARHPIRIFIFFSAKTRWPITCSQKRSWRFLFGLRFTMSASMAIRPYPLVVPVIRCPAYMFNGSSFHIWSMIRATIPSLRRGKLIDRLSKQIRSYPNLQFCIPTQNGLDWTRTELAYLLKVPKIEFSPRRCKTFLNIAPRQIQSWTSNSQGHFIDTNADEKPNKCPNKF